MMGKNLRNIKSVTVTKEEAKRRIKAGERRCTSVPDKLDLLRH